MNNRNYFHPDEVLSSYNSLVYWSDGPLTSYIECESGNSYEYKDFYVHCKVPNGIINVLINNHYRPEEICLALGSGAILEIVKNIKDYIADMGPDYKYLRRQLIEMLCDNDTNLVVVHARGVCIPKDEVIKKYERQD